MLLNDDVMADRKAEACALACGLCGEERIEHALPHVGRNPAAIVTNPDLDAVTEVLCRGRKPGFMTIGAILRLALRRSIEAVGN